MVVPIYKKGDENVVSNYRGAGLLRTAYKIYIASLNERLKADLE